jgi:hypothetical protein
LSGYYDGNLNAGVIKEGFDGAFRIIERIHPNVPLTTDEWEAIRRKKYSLLRKIGQRLHIVFIYLVWGLIVPN